MTTQQTQNICITFVQRRPNVFDAGPTLYKCYKNVLCLLGVAGDGHCCRSRVALTLSLPNTIYYIVVFSPFY